MSPCECAFYGRLPPKNEIIIKNGGFHVGLLLNSSTKGSLKKDEPPMLPRRTPDFWVALSFGTRGRVWHPEFPDAAALSRDMSEDELRAVRQAGAREPGPGPGPLEKGRSKKGLFKLSGLFNPFCLNMA